MFWRGMRASASTTSRRPGFPAHRLKPYPAPALRSLRKIRVSHFVQTLEPVQRLELSPVHDHDRTMATIAKNVRLVAS